IVCTPAHDSSISSRFASFSFDSPIGWLPQSTRNPQPASFQATLHAGNRGFQQLIFLESLFRGNPWSAPFFLSLMRLQ
ncbi:MAG: hypothetical protein Q8O25_09785, partial [Sulfurisoma sp.]|nr:hypothetical protein [Sulfurisoma sp.]